MEVTAATGDIAAQEAGAIVIGIFEETGGLSGEAARIDQALDGAIARLTSSGEIRGKINEVTVVHSLGQLPATRVVLTGLGKPAELTLDRVRGAVAETLRYLQRKRVDTVATTALGAGTSDITIEKAAQAVTEGALLGTYLFRRHITKEAESGEIRALTIVGPDAANLSALEGGIERGRILAGAAGLARDMVNEPGNYMTPTIMAETAAKLAAEYGLELTVLEREQMQELGMGGLLGVAQGSRQPPKLIILRYSGRGGDGADIALVGKGITFDSGGISIKPSDKMEEMKGDMAGGAAVLAALDAIARLRPAVNVAAVVPATENLPDGSALKPGDIITAMNGKTIEIISTDAEGRLILADALAYTVLKLGARQLVDVATLTGSMRIALGNLYSGAFGYDQGLMDRVIAAGKEAGESIWQMPMPEEYKEQLKSEVADMKNVGSRYGGSITAAQFLAEFVGDTPWVHLDIAGTELSDKDKGYYTKGATGRPVRTLVNLVLSLAEA